VNDLDMIREVNTDEPRASGQRLATARERLMSTIAEEKTAPLAITKRKHRKIRVASWTTVGVAAAAAIVVLVGTMATPTNQAGPATSSGSTPTPANPTAPPANVAFVLNEAADHAINQTDEPLRPGQYRYVSERISFVGTAWNASEVTFAARMRTTETTWVPFDESGTWTKDVRHDGPLEVIVDNGASESEKSGIERSGPPVGRLTARCGDFFSMAADPCHHGFDDKQLTSAMIATLPRDPQTLLREDLLDNDLDIALQRADIWLRSGLVPGDLRAALYRALASVPGMRITDGLANLDGRTGVAFGGNGRDIIIDPATGQFIGTRTIDDGTQGTPKGTVLDSSSLVTGVVDRVGDVPGN
jgi:hypothetical protein